MVVFVAAALLALGGAVVSVLDGPVAARPGLNRRRSATFLTLSGVALLAGLVWALVAWAAA
jgi:hypothetical protein